MAGRAGDRLRRPAAHLLGPRLPQRRVRVAGRDRPLRRALPAVRDHRARRVDRADRRDDRRRASSTPRRSPRSRRVPHHRGVWWLYFTTSARSPSAGSSWPRTGPGRRATPTPTSTSCRRRDDRLGGRRRARHRPPDRAAARRGRAVVAGPAIYLLAHALFRLRLAGTVAGAASAGARVPARRALGRTPRARARAVVVGGARRGVVAERLAGARRPPAASRRRLKPSASWAKYSSMRSASSARIAARPGADDRAREGAHLEVVGERPEPLGERVGEHRHAAPANCSSIRARSSGTVRASSWRWSSSRRWLGLRQKPRRRPRASTARIAATRPAQQLGGLVGDRRDQLRVELVEEDHVLLGREVAEERARRDLGRVGDLLHGGRLVPLLREQPQRVLPDGRRGSCLLSLAQSGRVMPILAHAPLACPRDERRTRRATPRRRRSRARRPAAQPSTARARPSRRPAAAGRRRPRGRRAPSSAAGSRPARCRARRRRSRRRPGASSSGAVPTPLRSAARAPIAASIDDGSANQPDADRRDPRRGQAVAGRVVAAPGNRAPAISAKPSATRPGAGPRRPAVAEPGADEQTADHRQQPQAGAERVGAADRLEVLRHREQHAEQRERRERRERACPR